MTTTPGCDVLCATEAPVKSEMSLYYTLFESALAEFMIYIFRWSSSRDISENLSLIFVSSAPIRHVEGVLMKITVFPSPPFFDVFRTQNPQKVFDKSRPGWHHSDSEGKEAIRHCFEYFKTLLSSAVTEAQASLCHFMTTYPLPQCSEALLAYSPMSNDSFAPVVGVLDQVASHHGKSQHPDNTAALAHCRWKLCSDRHFLWLWGVFFGDFHQKMRFGQQKRPDGIP